MIYPRWTAFRAGMADVGALLDVDGMPAWPIAKMRINGFDATITMTEWKLPDDPLPGDPAGMTVTCNGGATDAHDGTAYDWYLSQRTDDNTRQVLAISQLDATKSGTVDISTTALAARLVPSTNYVLPDAKANLFRRCDLYVQRQSDRAIQYLSLAVALGGYATAV